MLLDAGRAQSFGAYGYGRPTTPEIDRIAAEGVVFERVYTPAVYTLGAMSSLWTSQYPERHHSEVSFSTRLPKDRLTLAELLSGQGIHTAGFLANAVAGKGFGFDRGFAEFHEVFRTLGSRGDVFRKALPPWLATSRDRRLNSVLDRALKVIASTQCQDGGWDYHAPRQANGHDLSLAVKQAKALRSAMDSGLEVSPAVVDLAIKSRRWRSCARGIPAGS